MTTIIRYVTGFPKGIKLDSEKFDEVRTQYKLEKENKDVWEYNGPLELNDFSALRGILTSDQYFNLSRKDFLKLAEGAMHGNVQLTNPYRNMHDLRISKRLLSILEELLLNHEEISSCNDAERYIHDQAEKNSLKVPISFSYPYKYEDLTYNTRALVFLNGEMRGDITLSKTRSYNDRWAGYTEEGAILANVLGQKRRADWDSWAASNSLRWIADPLIREEILKEKTGIIFTRL